MMYGRLLWAFVAVAFLVVTFLNGGSFCMAAHVESKPKPAHCVHSEKSCPLKAHGVAHQCASTEGQGSVICCAHHGSKEDGLSTTDSQIVAAPTVPQLSEQMVWTLGTYSPLEPRSLLKRLFRPPRLG